jgi:hypothetical protein
MDPKIEPGNVYRCRHCLRELPEDVFGQPVPCPDHPHGDIDTVPAEE